MFIVIGNGDVRLEDAFRLKDVVRIILKMRRCERVDWKWKMCRNWRNMELEKY